MCWAETMNHSHGWVQDFTPYKLSEQRERESIKGVEDKRQEWNKKKKERIGMNNNY